MLDLQHLLQFVNVLILPLLYYLHRIDQRLTKLETTIEMLHLIEKKIEKELKERGQ